jgi:twinkle protein
MENNFNTRTFAEVFFPMSETVLNPPLGVPTPWYPSFHKLLGGFRPHEFTILSAPTGAGKTELLANLSTQFLEQGVSHFVAPVETGDIDFAGRVTGCFGRTNLLTGEAVNINVLNRIGQRMADSIDMKKLLIADYQDRVPVDDMVNLIEWHVEANGIKVALLDNLNFFLKVTRASDTLIEMDEAVHKFIMAVKKLPVHVLLIMHPRKTEGGRIESEFDIKGSSTSVQEAANVILFNKPKIADINSGMRQRNERELFFAKIRKRGWNAGKSIWFNFQDNRYVEEQENAPVRRP